MPLLFSLTLFCTAFLLFQVQPMVGKMLLPKLGGTPAVWNACMVFFQAALLVGYAYAHAATKLLGSRIQSLLHLAVLLLPIIALPIVISDEAFRSASTSDSPIVLVLMQLALTVGLPFFVVSTTAPMLQRWFADTGHASARDPYFLYAASNLGSMLSLLAYPTLVEPRLALDDQSRWWMWGYAASAGLVALCAAALWLRGKREPRIEEPAPRAAREPLTWRRRLWWIALAFVPSSLLLGTTTYVSTDIAPIPLLWIVPLALYLLTFILVFAKRPLLPHRLMCRALPIAVLALALVLVSGATELRGLPVWVLLSLHLVTFFLAAMVGHGELARDRPDASHLTEFFLWMSVGGVLGGMFNALLAPVIFARTGLTEYPLALVLACLIRPTPIHPSLPDMSGAGRRRRIILDVVLPAVVGLMIVAVIYGMSRANVPAGPLRTAFALGVPALVVFTFVDRLPRFALGIATLMLAGSYEPQQDLLFMERNFFGVVKVADLTDPEGRRFRVLVHGNTVHGQMSLETVDADGRHEPLTYYHRTGPIGVVCRTWFEKKPDGLRVAGVGLGTGSLAYYARPGDRWSFFEIDPAIAEVAENPTYFPFMTECRAGVPWVILGDAYLRLQEVPEQSYDMLILDAFSSDSIPMHLMTREALALYRSRLKPGGIMAFHISNRYLNLRPILAKLAEDAGLVGRGWYDSSGDKKIGKFDSEWVIVAEREEDFGAVAWPRGMDSFPDARWETIRPKPNTPLWTNNFSNLLAAFGRPDLED